MDRELDIGDIVIVKKSDFGDDFVGKVAHIIDKKDDMFLLSFITQGIGSSDFWPRDYLVSVTYILNGRGMSTPIYQTNPTCTECNIPNPYAEVEVGKAYTCRACVLRRSAY